MADPFITLVRELRAEVATVLREARRAGSGSLPAAKAVQRALKATAGRWPGAARWACTSGCAWCCHNAVSVSAPEAFRLAREVRTWPAARREALERLLEERAPHLASLALDQQAQERTRCALLGEDGACGAYDARPLPCIGMVSLDAKACEQVSRAPGGSTKIPVDRTWFSISGAHNLALRLGSRDAGLPFVRYELHDALRVALGQPDAERRWLAGEDPFSACRPDPTCVQPDALAELEHLDRLTR